MARWRIYYDDKPDRNHTDGLPKTEGERLGVQCIVQQGPDRRFRTIHGAEYYLNDLDGYWIPLALNGLEDWSMNCHGRYNAILKGRATGQFIEIFKRAKEDSRNEALD